MEENVHFWNSWLPLENFKIFKIDRLSEAMWLFNANFSQKQEIEI